MGIFDKAKDLAASNAGAVDGIVDKAGDIVDEKTGGKFAGQVDQGQDLVKGQYGGGQEEAPAEAPAPPAEEIPAGVPAEAEGAPIEAVNEQPNPEAPAEPAPPAPEGEAPQPPEGEAPQPPEGEAPQI